MDEEVLNRHIFIETKMYDMYLDFLVLLETLDIPYPNTSRSQDIAYLHRISK